jgi:hypothetical protein
MMTPVEDSLFPLSQEKQRQCRVPREMSVMMIMIMDAGLVKIQCQSTEESVQYTKTVFCKQNPIVCLLPKIIDGLLDGGWTKIVVQRLLIVLKTYFVCQTIFQH